MEFVLLALLVLAAPQDPDIEALLSGLSDESIEVRTRSAKSLIEIGARAEAKLRAKMESSEGEVRRVCEVILARYERQKRVESAIPPLKRVTLDAKDQKLKDVLQEIHRQSGLPFEFAELQDVPITLQVKNATPLEAVTAVCKAANLGFRVGHGLPPKGGAPQVKKEAAVWLTADGYSEAPRRFERHFLLECARVGLRRMTRFDGPSLSGHLSLRLTWPPSVRPDQVLVDIAAVHDDKGKSLYEKPSYARFGESGFGMMPGQVTYSTEVGVEFKHPGGDVEKVSVRGTALILFAGEDRYIIFESPEKSLGQRKELADMSVELRDLKQEKGMTVVTIAFTGRPKNAVPGMRVAMGGLGSRFYKVRLEDGTSVDCRSTSGRGEGSVQVMDLNFQGLSSKIAAVEVLAETAYHEERFDFELKDIALPK